MISKMGGRMIHYYSDELVDLLLDDMLSETALEMQKVEHKERQTQVVHESKQLAENLLQHINDF